MIKKLTLGVVAAISSISFLAKADEPSITILDDQLYYGGFMPQCISANGKYVCGSSYSGVGFISDWKEHNTKVYNGRDGLGFASTFGYITNDGIGLSHTKINFVTDETEPTGAGGFVDMMTEDGTILVGMTPKKTYSDFGSPHNIEYQACYWENGEMKLLPVPSEEELGYYYLRTRARCISSDGKVILGEIVDRLYQLPMILWYRQDDGSYKLDAVCEKYFSDIKYNEGFYKEYVTFQGCALSKNGKWVAMILRESPEYGKPAYAPLQIALYNVETGEIKKAIVTEDFNIPDTPHYFIYYNGVSDSGSIAGYYESDMGGESGFIMRVDDMTPRNFIYAFPTIGAFADYEDGYLNRVSSLSPDGRYITGYGWVNDRYEGYVFDTGTTDADFAEVEDSSVKSPEISAEGEPEYYTLSGLRLERPSNGIYIVRYPDGRVEKIVK